MKLVKHVSGKLRVYKNGLGFSTSVYRWDNTKLVPKILLPEVAQINPITKLRVSNYEKVPTGTSYIQVIKNWGKAFLNSFNHGIHAPKNNTRSIKTIIIT